MPAAPWKRLRSLVGATAAMASLALAAPLPAAAAPTSGAIRVARGGGPALSLPLADGRVSLDGLLSAFSLRTSVDLLGDRLDVVGPAGSCRLLLGSPLVLSRGAFSVLSAPLSLSGGQLTVPVDFTVKALPSLLGRSVTLDRDGGLSVGAMGSGGFQGVPVEEVGRYASFIERDQYAPAPPPTEHGGVRVVVIDPGHGGRSPGARGPSGTLEKDLVLLLAERLKARLEEQMGAKVVLTRTADYFVGLKERTAIANNNRADVFVSLHANAAFRGEIDGIETYYLSLDAVDREAGLFASEENEALGVRVGKDDGALMEAILWDMAQVQFLSQSAEAATLLQQSLVSRLRGADRGVRQAPLAVLMGARMPAVLVEVGYLSNPEQELRMGRPAYQDEVARAIADGVASFARRAAGVSGEVRP